MNSIKIFLKTLSYTLVGCGESKGMVDNDIVYDSLGLPYIPSRRIKGLFKESATEVCEMLGISIELVDSLFGRDGFNPAKIYIDNLYVTNYKEIKREIEKLKEEEYYKHFLYPEKIISCYTVERYQTAIDAENGTAKENSLRTSRVLKPNIEFEGAIFELKPLSEKEKALLYLASINLRRIGTLRNRGFGQVRCWIEGIDFKNVVEAIEKLKCEEESFSEVNKSIKEFKCTGTEDRTLAKLVYTIKTLSPIVIASPRGEQNTVYTKTYIPALTVKGLIVNQFIRLMDLGENAHQNDYFYKMFLKGEIIFTPAYPAKENRIFEPIPLCLQPEKGSEPDVLYNLFDPTNESRNTKPMKKFWYFTEDKVDNGNCVYELYEPETIFYFHNSRDRQKGHSVGEGIFYYEAIDSEQEFKGEIVGPRNYLLQLKELIGSFEGFIGRSKTAQYGLVKFDFGEIKDIETQEDIDDEYIIYALSPIIVYNCYGFTEPSERVLKSYLAKILECKEEDIEIMSSAAKVERLENFVGVWKMKSSSEIAYAAGSCFRIKLRCQIRDFKDKINEILINGIGEKTQNGYGRVKIYFDLAKKYQKRDSKEEHKEKVIINKSVNLIEDIVKSDLFMWAKIKGFEKAREFDKKKEISSHLIGRLENLLSDSKNLDTWKKGLSKFSDKQAGKKLKKVRLWDELFDENSKVDITVKLYNSLAEERDFNKYFHKSIFGNLKWNIEQDTDFLWEFFKAYWLSFLRYLRLFKKREEEVNVQN